MMRSPSANAAAATTAAIPAAIMTYSAETDPCSPIGNVIDHLEVDLERIWSDRPNTSL